MTSAQDIPPTVRWQAIESRARALGPLGDPAQLPLDFGPDFEERETGLDQLVHSLICLADRVPRIARGEVAVASALCGLLDVFLVLLDADHKDEASFTPSFTEFDEGASGTPIVTRELECQEADLEDLFSNQAERIKLLRRRAELNRVDSRAFVATR